MTHQISESIETKLPAATIWEVLRDYGGIEKYAPTISSSSIVGEKSSGVGAKRKVTFHHDGSSVIEEITEFNDGRGYKMGVSELSSPLRRMQAEMRVDETGTNSSSISMVVNFDVKGGPFGKLMGALMIKPMMKGVVRKVLTGLAYHSATGKVVDTKLPSEEELRSAFG